jgi:hypothetical protein
MSQTLVVHDESVSSSDTSTLNLLVKQEDTPHVSGDRGIQMLGVVNETQVDLANTEGDYVPTAFDKKGRAQIKIVNDQRSFTISTTSAPFVIPAAIKSGSVMNTGANDGTLSGQIVPPGVSIPLNPGSNAQSASAINGDATGTTFVIIYWI